MNCNQTWTLTTANVSTTVNGSGQIEFFHDGMALFIVTPEELEIISEWVRFVREKKL